jgi:ATP-dependent helicase Lhr and Lhr-like helicase
MVLSRVSPLAVPVLLEIGRESVRTDSNEEALLAEAEAIIAEATGETEPPRGDGVPAIHRANQTRRPTGAQKTHLPRRAPARQSDLFS